MKTSLQVVWVDGTGGKSPLRETEIVMKSLCFGRKNDGNPHLDRLNDQNSGWTELAVKVDGTGGESLIQVFKWTELAVKVPWGGRNWR